MTISFQHEYRKHILTSRCDVINDVINIKNIFFWLILDGLFISNIKMNLSKLFRNFQNGRHFEVGRTSKPEVVREVKSYTKIGHAIPYILGFCSTF